MQSKFLSPGRWLRALAWCAGTLVLLWGLGWLIVPRLIVQQLEKTASEQLGRKVTVGAVDFKPWTLELTIRDLAIATQDGSQAQFQFKRLYANAALESLLRLAPVVESIALDEPRVRLAHLGSGKYDVDDILARFASKPSDKPSEPFHFALFNLTLGAGSVVFEDRPVQKTHTLSALALGIPFLSNLPARHHIKVEPHLAFDLNGSHFDSTAQTTPFAVSRKTDASLVLRDLNLAPYLPYLPPSLPVRLQQGVLAAQIKVAFEQAPTTRVQVSGELGLSDVKMADTAGRDLLRFESLKVAFADVRPLDKMVKLSLVELAAPQVQISRDAAGRLNLDTLAQPGAPVPESPRAASSASTASGASDQGGWKLDLAKLVLRDGALQWTDASVAPQSRVAAQSLAFEATDIHWPMEQPLAFQGGLVLADLAAPPTRVKGATKGGPTELKFGGSATDRQASVKVSVSDLPLSLAAPYLASVLHPVVSGRLRTDFTVDWNPSNVKVSMASLVADELALGPRALSDAGPWPSVRQISVSASELDLARHTVTIGKLAVSQPQALVQRGRDGRWMFAAWLQPAQATPQPLSVKQAPGPSAMPAPAPAAPPWSVLLSDLLLDGGEIAYRDEATARPVAFALSGLKVQAKDLRPEGAKPIPVQVSARLKSERAEPGQLDFRGNLQWQPVVAQGSVSLTQIPVHVFEPYFGGGLNIELLRADTGFKGEVRFAQSADGPSVQLTGDAVVEDFRANSLAAGDAGLQIAEELLNWKSLSLRGINLAVAPGNPTRVAISETTLGDFFARVIVFPNGRINLQDLGKSDTPAAAAPQAAASASAVTTTAAASPLPASAPAAAQIATASAATDAVINIGPVALINGKVFFSDRFVRPNYSANLSELTGKLSAFSSMATQGQVQLADLELRGRAEGTASLEILGKVNPLAKPLALDIQGKVRDLELPPLSPYAVKYAGHGIERGKLSVDVAYLVKPDGQLTASNQIILNQLSFGEKVDGAPASLPVKLAVALLSDRNGVIDINLPISGSLNDPQFSLGPIIFKVIVNLIVKAITSPFSLLASAFGGGGDELSAVAFAPGSAVLLPEARTGLDKVARALTDRPALKMTVVGTASLDAEREAYKRERLRALLVSEKRRSLLAGAATAAQAGAGLTVSDAEVPALIKEVYKRSDITKPRNLVGVAQDIPAEEMEALLLANIPASEDTMRELAVQRGVAVKDYLGSQNLPVERLFLGAVKPAVANDPKWAPRAELSLAN